MKNQKFQVLILDLQVCVPVERCDTAAVVADPGLLFQASLTSAQVLLPGSQASLSSLLLEGHSLLALAAVMFAPGGIDQVSATSALGCLMN